DPHFKVVKYIENSADVFPNTDIKGGIIVSLWDLSKDFGSIITDYAPAGIFIPYPVLVSIMRKVVINNFKSFSKIVHPRTIYNFTEEMHKDHPDAASKLSKCHANDVTSNIFDRLPEIFCKEMPQDGKEYIKIVGRKNFKRKIMYIERK